MFIYKPLVDTINKNKSNLNELCEKLGIKPSIFRLKLNDSQNITMSQLEEICSLYKCQPNDVITWVEGDRKRSKVNWDMIDKLMKEKSMTLTDLAYQCHMDRTSLYKAKTRDSTLNMWVIEVMAKYLKCNVEDIL